MRSTDWLRTLAPLGMVLVGTGCDGAYDAGGVDYAVRAGLAGSADGGVAATGPCALAPTSADKDEDGLPDFYEVCGYTDKDGNRLDLAAAGAKPDRRDVFLQISYYEDRKPKASAIEKVKAAFLAAPLKNPDGSRGITLHVDVDEKPIAKEDVVLDITDDVAFIKKIKEKKTENGKPAYFKPERAFAYHYAVFANQLESGDWSGVSVGGIPASDFLVTLGTWATKGGTELQQAGTLMHELGHNLGLGHGGAVKSQSNPNLNYRPNYLSIMNYQYQTAGLTQKNGEKATQEIDYSRFTIKSLTESALDETAAMDASSTDEESDLARYINPIVCIEQKEDPKYGYYCNTERVLKGNAAAKLDFDNDTKIYTPTKDKPFVAADLDGLNGTKSVHDAVVSDWHNLIFTGGNIGKVIPQKLRYVVEDVPCMAHRTPSRESSVSPQDEAPSAAPESPSSPFTPSPSDDPSKEPPESSATPSDDAPPSDLDEKDDDKDLDEKDDDKDLDEKDDDKDLDEKDDDKDLDESPAPSDDTPPVTPEDDKDDDNDEVPSTNNDKQDDDDKLDKDDDKEEEVTPAENDTPPSPDNDLEPVDDKEEKEEEEE